MEVSVDVHMSKQGSEVGVTTDTILDGAIPPLKNLPWLPAALRKTSKLLPWDLRAPTI